jgi:hypothetical protein
METYGKKEKVAVVALNIRNISELEESGGDGFSVVSRIIQEAKLLRARYKDERDYKLFIFAPSIMKELQIGSKVLSFIKRAEQTLTDYNKKHALKVQCGIGANVGEMIVEAVDGHYKLSAFGSLVILAKKAASRSKGESLIAASMRKEYLNLVRGEALPGMNFWRLDNVINREPHREFLDRFSKRNFSQLR